MNKAAVLKGFKRCVRALDAALDEQQRAANGQFGSGGGSSSSGSEKVGVSGIGKEILSRALHDVQNSSNGTAMVPDRKESRELIKSGELVEMSDFHYPGHIVVTSPGQHSRRGGKSTGDAQSRAANGQFGSGGSATTAGSAKNKAAGQAAANAFAGGSPTAAKNAARLLANKTSMGTTSSPGKVQTGTARLKSTLASNASRNGKN